MEAMNPQRQAVRRNLNIYILFVVLLSVYQFYKYETTKSPDPSPASSEAQQTSRNSTTNSQAQGASDTNYPYILYATQHLEPVIRQLMTTHGFEPSNTLKPYVFEGKQWLLNIALTYGHLVIGMYVFSYYNNPQLERGKKTKIMLLGMGAMFAFITIAGNLAIQRVDVKQGNHLKWRQEKVAFSNQTFVEYLNQNSAHFPKTTEEATIDSSSSEENTPSNPAKRAVDGVVIEGENIYSDEM